MDSKGIELTGLNLAAPAAAARDMKKESAPVRPVTKMEKAELTPRRLKEGEQGSALNDTGEIGPDEAKEAADILQDYLSDHPELETAWGYDKERGILVVEIRDKRTGEILRTIPPEDILSGRILEKDGRSGSLLDTTI